MRTWRYIEEDGVSASYGMAGDEFLLHYCRESGVPALRLYTYRSYCIMVGRFQGLGSELRPDILASLCFGGRVPLAGKGLEINRRLTGGGTVVMGEDQLGVALAAPQSPPFDSPEAIFKYCSLGLIEGLKQLGIAARLRGKNDLAVDERKIAGLGVYLDEADVFLFHASLLVDFDLGILSRLFNIPLEKLSDKGVSFLEQRFTTVSRELGKRTAVGLVREAVAHGYERALDVGLRLLPFTEGERDRIAELEARRYLTREWLEERSPTPEMSGHVTVKTKAGLVTVYVSLVGDVIREVLISGDFMATGRGVAGVEAALKWAPAEEAEVRRAVAAGWRSGGIMKLSPEELAGIILQAVDHARAGLLSRRR